MYTPVHLCMERNQSYPDINTFTELCWNLQIRADVLLETECGNLSENKDVIINDEIRKILRDCEEPFVLEFGVDIMQLFIMDESYVERTHNIRKELAKIGILLPAAYGISKR